MSEHPLPPSFQLLVRQRDQYKQWWLEAKGERNQWMDRAAEHGARELELRNQLAELRAAVREWVARMDEAHPGWHALGPVTNLLEAGDNLRRIAEEQP